MVGSWRPVGVVCVLAWAATTVRAEGPQVSVHVDACVPVDRAQLDRVLGIELGTSATANAVTASPTEVWVGCSPRGIELRVEDAITRKSMTRTLPATSFTDASSTRLLALAIAEFVVASWIELRVQPHPAVEPVGPPTSPAARQAAEQVVQARAAPEGPPNDSLSAAFTLQVWSGNDAFVLGGGVRLLRLASPVIAWTVAADFGATSIDVSYGSVRLLTASVATAIAMHLRVRDFALYTGPGGRMGFARMQGVPGDRSQNLGDHFFAPYGGPMWWGRAELWATEQLRLALELEVGVVTLPARALAGSRRLLDLDGAWFTTGLSMGVGF